MSNAQLACTYAALILAESGNLDAAKIHAVTKAAGVEVSQGMAAAFANALSSVNVNETLSSVSFGGAAAGGSAPAAAASSAAPAGKAAKKEEPEEEEDDEMGFGLFD